MDYKIRKATLSDLSDIKLLADAYKNELGFVLRPALSRSIERNSLIIAQNSQGIIGFVEYHHRRDKQTTLHHIVVRDNHQRKGIGSELINQVVAEAKIMGSQTILLKCPEGLTANEFYKNIGFQNTKIENNKVRKLVVWTLKTN